MPNALMNNINYGNDYRIILICNAYSTNQEYFARPMNLLVDALGNNSGKAGSIVAGGGGGNASSGTSSGPGGVAATPSSSALVASSGVTVGSADNCPVAGTTPFSIVVLDSLTVHGKMSLIHGIVSQMIKQAQCKTSLPTPALVETYARLLVYTEIESLGIKGFLCKFFSCCPIITIIYSCLIVLLVIHPFSSIITHRL